MRSRDRRSTRGTSLRNDLHAGVRGAVVGGVAVASHFAAVVHRIADFADREDVGAARISTATFAAAPGIADVERPVRAMVVLREALERNAERWEAGILA